MKRPWIWTALSVVLLLPFAVNLLGWNIYFYTNVGKSNMVLAAAQGLSHNAIADHFEEVDLDILPGFLDAYKAQYHREVLEVGPFRLFVERVEGFPHGLGAGVFTDPAYMGFEFPWLVLPLVTGAIATWRWTRLLAHREAERAREAATKAAESVGHSA